MGWGNDAIIEEHNMVQVGGSSTIQQNDLNSVPEMGTF